MKATLSVKLEKGLNGEELISAHFDMDDNDVMIEKESYQMLLSAVTTKMLLEKANETQDKLVEVMKKTTAAIELVSPLKKNDFYMGMLEQEA